MASEAVVSSAKKESRKRKLSELSNSTDNNRTLEEGNITSWTEESIQILFDRINDFITKSGEKRPKKVIFPHNIDWDIIKFDKFTAEICKQKWSLLASRVRRQRTLKEILDDAQEKHRQSPGETNISQLKKPVTAFFLYLRAKRPSFIEKHPDLSTLEVTKRLSEKWKKLSEERKKKYHLKYEKNKAEYNQKLTSYYIKTFPELDQPKTAFELWKVEESKKILQERGDLSDKKLRKKLKRRWENQEEEVTEIWEKKARIEAKRFIEKAVKHAKQISLH